MAKCAACGRFLNRTGAAECGNCPLLYHKGCVGILDVDAVESGWTCPECKRVQKKGDNTNTPVKGTGGTHVPSISCDAPNRSSSPAQLSLPIPSISTPQGEDANSEIRLMRRELAEYMTELREFRKEFRSAQVSIGQRIDGLESRLKAVEQKEEVTPKVEVADLQVTVALLKAELNDRDQEALLSDLDIGHLPEVAGENVGHTVTVLAAKLGVSIQEQDIVFAERVGRADHNAGPDGAGVGRPRRVVVRLARRTLRDRILQAARVRRTLTSTELGLAGPPRRIYVNERLTKTNRQLFHRVREECRKREWRYAWTKQGRVFARQGDGKQVYHIRADANMDRVFDPKNV